MMDTQGVMGALDTALPGQDRLFNLGNTHPHTVNDLVSGLETALGKTAIRHYVDLPNLGDVLQTHSNISAATAAFNYTPQVCIR
jgi:UDP-glucose 4-epimerase